MPLAQIGKVAAITGGLTGIGRAIALDYLRHGAKVAVNHLGGPSDEPFLEALRRDVAEIVGSEEGRFLSVAGDVTQPATGREFVEKTVEAFGRLDVFVSNAGVCKFEDFLEYARALPYLLSAPVDPPLLGHTVSTNLCGAFYATQAAARQMAKAQSPPGGSIIGISSISALVGGGQQTHYTPTKAGVLSLMQSCAVALGQYGIRCNALLPGTIRTQLNDADMSDPAKRAYMEGRIPLGRLGQPPDLAGPAVFLACEELSGYVTGAQLLVDGGLFVNLQ
ncbi:SDR family NAD(P)-dependent oxidoreductase [Aspergillus clavatus NRRL 1]|uniref:Short-chain dehydrogenase n=1 Tax=Aspergillus clavatus (strain ATCC 1007 / CBS 513.65 / DSM 816 / NCTC 3887 / NRRL 1 / QM 1276 / 107) TaxID=344612 RepID=A1CDC3_ASPCL|nr:short-chain dehydrogenase [Aspergillus clavatus NRRL 1]EAW11850.1 short-chain dehydrogenase [Aspergillus clavatus NRRL 1]